MWNVECSQRLVSRVLGIKLNAFPKAFTLALLLLSLPLTQAEPPSPAAVLQELRSFREMGGVLYVAAHPDDENTQMIAYLARGKNYRTAYLSLTRGDGGQNVLSSDLDEQLGVARTQELLAARRLDGGRQFFTRAIDFGFSKDYRETLNIWNKQEVLADMVRIIRHFQPDVIMARFSPQPGGTHGHHTASAVLAVEAFKLAGDPNAFPEQLKTLKPWQPKRIFMNGRGGEGLRMEISGQDAVSGKSLEELAGRSRAMHKTQGFDNYRGGGGGPRSESLQLLDGATATNHFMEGIDTTWNRIPGGAEVEKLAGEMESKFDSEELSANVPQLLKLRAALAGLPVDLVVTEKRQQLDRILAACLGLEVKTEIAAAEAVPGERLVMKHSASVKSGPPVRWMAVRYPKTGKALDASIDLKAGQPTLRESAQTLPKDIPLTQPYWLREERTVGTFRVQDLSLITEPENPPAFLIEQVFEVGGQTLVLADEPVQTKAGMDVQDRPLDIIPHVSIGFASSVSVFAPGSSREMEVELSAARDVFSGVVQ
ncbi:MAG: PIG-L family deacetylase, partial [Akkermansiaceae bacterium]|nr:PIG-L family deacetylase [Verrucomicrobiales bacterium]